MKPKYGQKDGSQTGRGSSGTCGETRRRDGSGRGVGNRNTSRPPRRKTLK